MKLNELLKRSKRTVNELKEAVNRSLAEESFHVSSRTIYNDLKSMEELYSVEIVRDAKARYYYEDSNSDISKATLTADERFLFEIALRLFHGHRFSTYFEKLNKLISRIFSDKILENPPEDDSLEYIQLGEFPNDYGLRWLDSVFTAIKQRKTLCVEYQPLDGEINIRILSPYLLKEYKSQWYLIAHVRNLENGSVKIFRLNRINRIDLSTEMYISPEEAGFDRSQYFKYTLGIYQYNDLEPILVRLRFWGYAVGLIKETPLHPTMRIEKESEGSIEVSIEVFKSPELCTLILGYGTQVEVLGPADFRRDMAGVIANMNAVYQRN